jgi:tight adherence protein B
MNMNLLAQDWFVLIGVGAGIFGFMMMSSEKIISWLHDKSLGSRTYVLEKFEVMFIENSEKKVTITMLLLSFGLGFLVFLLMWPSIITGFIFGAIVTAVGWQVPKILVDMVYEKRCKKFVSQMVDGLTIMSNGIRAGLSVTQSMERVTQNLGNPIKQEFDYCLSQIRLGLSVEEALNNLAQRIPEQDVQMFVMSINILNQTGGDLATTFSTITETIRERQKILQKIDAMTAQGKTQGMIMAMVPLALFGVFAVIDPGYIRPLYTSTLGFIFIFIMLVLVAVGGVVMRKVVTIKV